MSYVALKCDLDSTPTFSSDDSDLGHLQLHPTDGVPRSHRQCAHSCLESRRDTGEEGVGMSDEEEWVCLVMESGCVRCSRGKAGVSGEGRNGCFC